MCMCNSCVGLTLNASVSLADNVMITPKDARWVGAWWLGFLVSSAIMLLASLPFWFLPRSLPKQGEEHMVPQAPQDHSGLPGPDASELANIAKGKLSVGLAEQWFCFVQIGHSPLHSPLSSCLPLISSHSFLMSFNSFFSLLPGQQGYFLFV